MFQTMDRQVAKVNKVRSRDERTFRRVRSPTRKEPTPYIQERIEVESPKQNDSREPDMVDNLGAILTNPWVIVWVLAGLVTIFVPRIMWNAKKTDYYDSYGSTIYEQDYYEEQQRYYKQQKENYYGNNYNSNHSSYMTCHWYNWLSCRKKQYYYATYEERAAGEFVPNLPSWYLLFGGETEDMRSWVAQMNGEEEQEERRELGNESGFGFVYGLTIFMFIAMVVYGVIVIGKRKPVSSLILLLGFYFLMSLCNAIISVQGAITGERESLENSYYGWYGQVAVLLAYTDLWIMAFSGCFLIALIAKMFVEKAPDNTTVATNKGDYHSPESIQMT